MSIHIPQNDQPHPDGWFAFGFSDELAARKLLSRPSFGQALTVFRTQSGRAYAVSAYCPHLGARFSDGGTVQGESIECGHHGFRFNPEGVCIRTGHNIPIPTGTHLQTWPLRETNGLLLIYHSAENRLPPYEIPPVENDGWTKPIHQSLEIPTQAGWLPPSSQCIQQYGAGYALHELPGQPLGLTVRLWVLPNPVNHEQTTLRLAVRVKKTDSPISRLAAPLLARALLNRFTREAQQERPKAEN